jgi:hypothetical protein
VDDFVLHLLLNHHGDGEREKGVDTLHLLASHGYVAVVCLQEFLSRGRHVAAAALPQLLMACRLPSSAM